MESGEEPTELTAMTSGESRASSTDDSATGPLDPANNRAQNPRRKTLLKLYLKSPQGKCVFAVVMGTLLVLTAYVVSKLIMGLMFMDSCQLDPFIPIYLVTSASMFIAFVIIIIIIIVKCQREEDDDRVSPVHLVTFVYFFVHLVLQLAGSVCVIRTKNEILDNTFVEMKPNAAVSCEEVLLAYSFGVVIFELILSGLMFIFAVISICEVIYLECCKAPKHTKPPSSR